MGLESFTSAISSINYFKTKAKNIFETSKLLNQDYSLLRNDLDALQTLPGV